MSKTHDGKILLGSYSIYLTQLIITLEDDNSSWKTVICQVAVFVAIILSREYKKRNTDVAEASTQSEAPPSPPNEPTLDSLQTPNIQ